MKSARMFKSIEDVPKNLLDAWEKLDITVEQKPSWLGACEKLVGDYLPYYYIIHNDDSIEGIVISSLVKSLDCLYFVKDQNAKAQILSAREKDKGYFFFDVLFVSAPMSTNNGIIKVTAGIDDILADFRTYVKNNMGISAIFITNMVNQISNQNAVMFPYIPTTKLELPYSTFDGYLASLKKKKRWDLKNKRRLFLDKGCKTELLKNSDISDYRHLFELYLQTEEKGKENINYSFYSNTNAFSSFKELGDNYKWILVSLDSKLIGFALIVDDGKSLIFKHVGMDYSLIDGTYTYFNLYYEAITYAISRKLTAMHCGTTTYDVKRHLGCNLIDRNAYLDLIGNAFDINALKQMTF